MKRTFTIVLSAVMFFALATSSRTQTFDVLPTKLAEVGQPGQFLETSAEVKNLTLSDLMIRVQKKRMDLPQGWSTSICLINCFSPEAHDVTDLLPAGETAYLKLTFETSQTPANGEVELYLNLLSDPTENYTVVMKASTLSTSSTNDRVALPRLLTITQSYPNPFSAGENNIVSIGYTTPRTGVISLTVYNLLGKEVRTLVNEVKGAGAYTVLWDGRDNNNAPLPTGIYVYKISNGSTTLTKRLLLTR